MVWLTSVDVLLWLLCRDEVRGGSRIVPAVGQIVLFESLLWSSDQLGHLLLGVRGSGDWALLLKGTLHCWNRNENEGGRGEEEKMLE